ncbi:MAG: pyrroline-5-carboxylate reductase [Planctomycetota bacterium]
MSESINRVRIGILGAGRMATALARGWLDQKLLPPDSLRAADPVDASREQFAAATGVRAVADNLEVAAWADVIVLAAKPQQFPQLLKELQGKLTGKLVISIAAGVTLATLATLATGVGPSVRLVRVMPNTPCLVGRGASGFALGSGATADDSALVKRMFEAVGVAVTVEEKLLDAVTGLSGSGPAFAYVIVEALSDGGVRMGLPRDVATQLAAQTLLGAAAMVLETGDHPGVLKDRVASPGGTTIAGLQALEKGGLRAALIAAVEAATQRAVELGRQ